MLTQLLSFAPATSSVASFQAADGLPDAAEVNAACNAAKGRVRLVMLVSPTYPACVSGAEVIRNDVLNKIKDERLATFSVFIPMILGDSKTPAIEASRAMTKRGIPSYWDGKRELGTAYGQTVKLPLGKKVAWDIYFIYGPDAVWDKTPPKPIYWMHQLGYDDQCLDSGKSRSAVEKQLKGLK